MSTNREDFGVEYVVNAGTTKVLEAIIIDPDTNEVKSLSDTNLYHTGTVKIYEPDGTLKGDPININFGDTEDRISGLVTFTIDGTNQATLKNAGNWIGELEFFNISIIKIDQQFFNIMIKESH